jgi:opine dehydrogenase
MYGRRVHVKLTDSGDWSEKIELTAHRYMLEDVALGLAFLVSACEWAGVACPVARGLLALGSAVLGRELRAGPRTLEALGLAGLSRDEMRQLLREGA